MTNKQTTPGTCPACGQTVPIRPDGSAVPHMATQKPKDRYGRPAGKAVTRQCQGGRK